MQKFRFLVVLFAAAVACIAQAKKPLVVVVSVDGMRPDYVTYAEEHKLELPFLLGMMHNGVYAHGVVGVLPTYTYPSHTTLVTGVWPAKHGVLNNRPFDPLGKDPSAWWWSFSTIKVPTLWQAAHDAGVKTAAVNWPVTQGAPIDYNIPEFWNPSTQDDGSTLENASTPAGMLKDLEKTLGRYPSKVVDVANDHKRVAFAVAILKQYHPGLLAVHLAGLDTAQHDHGPFSEAANAAVQEEDKLLKEIYDAAYSQDKNVIFCVLSDHGFEPVSYYVSLKRAFVDAGLIAVDAKGNVTSWKAMPWVSGGTAAIMLNDPNDAETKQAVLALLRKLAIDPANGIGHIYNHDETVAMGGYPDAAFLVAMRPGWQAIAELKPEVATGVSNLGAHGYLASDPALRSAFFIMGPGLKPGKDLGLIDMRQIAPTLAGVLGAQLPTADGKAIDLK
jgi:predicted AlkP superfamily pyrophosphatase or phosphodiesterase